MCGLELPDIDTTIHQRYASDGVLVYGIHPGDPPELVAGFVEQTGVSFPIIPDENFSRGLFSFPGGVGYPYPRDVVIGKDLTVHSIKNSFDPAEMDALVQTLLAEDVDE